MAILEIKLLNELTACSKALIIIIIAFSINAIVVKNNLISIYTNTLLIKHTNEI